ncbi:MAG: HTH-type transcriptional regulator KipR [Noviherbaspirillum sp.]|nr:HTH-type transcriptional regulator KipR [Noviherbaspirillum sp.]MDB5794761.1 HTH-type transcriptional regulator KipR [Noviherbaspirillum sp.]
MENADSQSSLAKMISVLDVIEASSDGLTFEEMLEAMKLSRSTLYRYLKVLSEAGLIVSLPNFGYTLGPRVAELDLKMRTQDPLIAASVPVMTELARTVPGVVLLCRKYRDKVLCVHQEGSSPAFRSGYERGQDRPLFRGAASRIILAYTEARAIARLYAERGEEFAQAQLGNSLDEVKTRLAQIRQAGYDRSTAQVTPGVTGIAAPLFDSKGTITGSLSVTLGSASLRQSEVDQITERVKLCAGIVSQAISRPPALGGAR